MAITMPEIFSPASFELAMEIFQKAMIDESKKTRQKPDKPRTVELELLRKDGSTVPVEVTFSFIRDSNKELTEILSVVRDITHRKQIEAQFLAYQEELRSLASELSLSEERERRRMATEVHDRLSQSLAICHMKLGALLEVLPSMSSTDHIREIQTIIRQLIDETRSIAFEFSSPLLYDFGLEAAVGQLIEQIQKQHSTHFNFEHGEQAKLLGNDTRVLLYQTVRELLTNIVKHAQARHARVCMKRQSKDFCIIIEDDGVGFDMSGPHPKRKKTKGFGLFSIRERLKYIGGQIEIESEPGQGTQVTISVPLKQ
jgi:signal transduction histidine kinase